VDITFEVVKIGWYEIYYDEEIDVLYREFIASIGPELAHNSEAWACLGCGGERLVSSEERWIFSEPQFRSPCTSNWMGLALYREN
jgi:hypothetical protein